MPTWKLTIEYDGTRYRGETLPGGCWVVHSEPIGVEELPAAALKGDS